MRPIHHFTFLVLISLFSCQLDPWQDPNDVVPPISNSKLPCNGDTSLCRKTPAQVVFPTTLKSYNYEFGAVNYLSPSQKYPVQKQLEDGIRGLNFDVYDEGGQVIVANKVTLIGNIGEEPLSGPLMEIRDFLLANPREVVVLNLNTEVSPNRLKEVFSSTSTWSFVYYPATGWTTLENLITTNKRLIVMSNNTTMDDWIFSTTAFGFSTGMPNSRSDFNCVIATGNPGNDLFIFNHRVGVPLLSTSNADSASAVNEFDILYNHAAACTDIHGKKPNFVGVDFYSSGDLFEVCETLNQMH